MMMNRFVVCMIIMGLVRVLRGQAVFPGEIMDRSDGNCSGRKM